MWRIGNNWIPIGRITFIAKDPEDGAYVISIEDYGIYTTDGIEEHKAFDFFMNEVQAASVIDINMMYENRDKIRIVQQEMKERMTKKQDAKSKD